MHALSYLILFLFICGNTTAQQFQWIKGGGTNESSANLDIKPEGTYHMSTDANGNVYALSVVGQNAIFADTFYRGSAYGNDWNILLSSYDCAGQMRWAKLLGSNSGFSNAIGIACDSFGHVYVACAIANGTSHIGLDTSITTNLNKVLKVIQFDTNGHLNWLREIGNNTVANRAATYLIEGALALDNTQNVHLIAYFGAGAVFTPTVTSHLGNYDIKFNSSGILLSAKRLQIDSTLGILGAAIDQSSNFIYAYGYRSPAFPDSSAYNFLSCFDTNGNRLWIDTLGMNPALVSTGNFSGVEPDGKGHLYVSGAGFDYLIYQGDTIRAPVGAYIAFIMKTDTTGNKQWVKTPQGHTAFVGITKASENVIAATGYYYVSMSSGSVSLSNTTPGSDPIIFLVDTVGQFVDLKGFHGNGYLEWGQCIAHDRNGNIFVGGLAADTLPVGSANPYVSVGGPSDFFILKYGMPCGCTTPPTAAFSASGTNPVTFTYTGTTSGVDSVVWHFGDGTTATGNTANHTYSYSDTFQVCVCTYAYCGIDSSCLDIPIIGLGIQHLDLALISLAPNPATAQLSVNGLNDKTTYRLLDMTGRCIGNGTVSPVANGIALQGIGQGMYILQLTDASGLTTRFSFIKQ